MRIFSDGLFSSEKNFDIKAFYREFERSIHKAPELEDLTKVSLSSSLHCLQKEASEAIKKAVKGGANVLGNQIRSWIKYREKSAKKKEAKIGSS